MSKQSSRGSSWAAMRTAALNRDGWVCQYCGKYLEGSDATADHIVPKNLGGTDDLSNLVACCRKCNGMKSDRIHQRLPYVNKNWDIPQILITP